MTKSDPQQLILEAVITCIEKYGLEKTTTRKIAREAGTNIASINYYFRSKDDLIAQALGVTLQHMQEDLVEIVRDQERSFDLVLRAWLAYLIEGARLYPRVFMAHMYAPLVEKRFDTPGPQAFRKMVDLLSERAAQAYPAISERQLQAGLEDMVSAVMFRMLAPEFFSDLEKPAPEELAERYAVIFTQVISAN
jgi:AcrR family transcriptional regulator